MGEEEQITEAGMLLTQAIDDADLKRPFGKTVHKAVWSILAEVDRRIAAAVGEKAEEPKAASARRATPDELRKMAGASWMLDAQTGVRTLLIFAADEIERLNKAVDQLSGDIRALNGADVELQSEKAAHDATKAALAQLREDRAADEAFQDIHERASPPPECHHPHSLITKSCPDCRRWSEELQAERDRCSGTLRLVLSYRTTIRELEEVESRLQREAMCVDKRLHSAETALRTSTKETPLTHGRAALAHFAAYPEAP